MEVPVTDRRSPFHTDRLTHRWFRHHSRTMQKLPRVSIVIHDFDPNLG